MANLQSLLEEVAGQSIERLRNALHVFDRCQGFKNQISYASIGGHARFDNLSLQSGHVFLGKQALRKVPQVNASWRGEFIREFADVNIGVAVQTDVGLLVPVLPKADGRGLGDISKGVKELAGKVINITL